MIRKRSNKIIEKLKGYYGIPKPDLLFSNLYQLTIAVVLSAQTTDKQVNNVTRTLFEKFPDFISLAGARVGLIEEIVRSSGFYHHKARNIINLSKIIMNEHNGKVPDDYNKLIKLPGVGRKSANVILSVGFGIPALAVDTHIIRIANRVGYVNSKDPVDVENALISVIAPDNWKAAHLLLIKHGRVTCMARNPLCAECPINSLCDFAGNVL
jgi:endonuclease III